MRNNYNKKKITFISKFKLIKYMFIFLTFILASFYFYDYILEKKIHREIIQEFSKKNNFVLASYETNELIRVDQSKVSKIINKYFGKVRYSGEYISSRRITSKSYALQTIAVNESIPSNASDAAANNHTRQTTVFEGPAPNADDAVRYRDIRQADGVIEC